MLPWKHKAVQWNLSIRAIVKSKPWPHFIIAATPGPGCTNLVQNDLVKVYKGHKNAGPMVALRGH